VTDGIQPDFISLAFGSRGGGSLLQLEQDRPHPGDVLGIARTLWVEVAQSADTLPLAARLALVSLLDERILVLSTAPQPTPYTHTYTQLFYGPFSGTTRVSQCQKRTSGLYGSRED